MPGTSLRAQWAEGPDFEKRFAEVVVRTPLGRRLTSSASDSVGDEAGRLQRSFHYSIPTALLGQLSVGHLVWVPYTDGGLQDNTWTVSAITGDYRNPGVLDPGEEMTIQIRIAPATQEGPDRWLVMSTDTGVTYTIYF